MTHEWDTEEFLKAYRWMLEPSSCGRCGIPRHGHGRQRPIGDWESHSYRPPNSKQIKARMWDRRNWPYVAFHRWMSSGR